MLREQLDENLDPFEHSLYTNKNYSQPNLLWSLEEKFNFMSVNSEVVVNDKVGKSVEEIRPIQLVKSQSYPKQTIKDNSSIVSYNDNDTLNRSLHARSLSYGDKRLSSAEVSDCLDLPYLLTPNSDTSSGQILSSINSDDKDFGNILTSPLTPNSDQISFYDYDPHRNLTFDNIPGNYKYYERRPSLNEQSYIKGQTTSFEIPLFKTNKALSLTFITPHGIKFLSNEPIPPSLKKRKSSVESITKMLNLRRNSHSLLAISNLTDNALNKELKGTQSSLNPDKPTVGLADPYFGIDYPPNEIKFKDNVIVSGTLRALIDRLTLHNSAIDQEFLETFILTFKSFTTSQEFLKLLIERFNLVADCPPEKLPLWKENKLKPIQIRVCNLLKIWIESYFHEEDLYLLSDIKQFLSTQVVKLMPVTGNSLLKLIFESFSLKKNQTYFIKSKVSEMNTASNLAQLPDILPPIPILPKGIMKSLVTNLPFRITEIDPKTIASQISIIDYKLFSKIRVHELISLITKERVKNRISIFGTTRIKLNIANAVDGMSKNTNCLVGTIVNSILIEWSPRKRANILKYFILLGNEFLELKNFNALVPVVGALSSASVARLKLSWENVSAKTMAIFKNLCNVISHQKNYTVYRTLLKNTVPPCVPFLGVFLTDLTFINVGNKTFSLTEPSMINFSKCTRTADVLRNIIKFQTPYYLIEIQELEFKLKVWLKSGFANYSEELAYLRSKVLEPKKGETQLDDMPFLQGIPLNQLAYF